MYLLILEISMSVAEQLVFFSIMQVSIRLKHCDRLTLRISKVPAVIL